MVISRLPDSRGEVIGWRSQLFFGFCADIFERVFSRPSGFSASIKCAALNEKEIGRPCTSTSPEFNSIFHEIAALPGLPNRPACESARPAGNHVRLRNRLEPEALSDCEFLELLLLFVQPELAKELAEALLARFGTYAAVLSAPKRELLAVRDIAEHTADVLKLVRATAIRLARADIMARPIMSNWTQLIAYLTAVLVREPVEEFRVLFLNIRNQLIADEALARGTINRVQVYTREIFKRALELNATALILVHNHPSGDPTPSLDDREMTAEVQMAAGALGLTVHDHIIVGGDRWLSFKQEGIL